MIKKYSWLNKTFDSLGKDRVIHGKRNFICGAKSNQ